MAEKRMLEVGDVLISTNCMARRVVDRVTKTQAICGVVRFRREYDGLSISEIGSGTWNRTRYLLATPASEAEFRRNTVLSKVQCFEFSKLTADAIERIHAIIADPTSHDKT